MMGWNLYRNISAAHRRAEWYSARLQQKKQEEQKPVKKLEKKVRKYDSEQ